MKKFVPIALLLLTTGCAGVQIVEVTSETLVTHNELPFLQPLISKKVVHFIDRCGTKDYAEHQISAQATESNVPGIGNRSSVDTASRCGNVK